MEKYTITKEQILELAKRDVNQYQLKEWFTDAFKEELEAGVWYKHGPFKFNFQGGLSLNHYGWNDYGNWTNELRCDKNFEAVPMTDEEVEEALKNEVIKRFGKDWRSAKIEKCLVHGYINGNFPIGITTNEIWNKNGCIYKNGVFAEPLKSKVITIEKAEKILSKKYGKKVTIK